LLKKLIRETQKMITDNKPLKITYKDLLAACKAAGIKEDDPLDSIDISWGSAENLQCVKDKDFGWQITMCEECAD
jgi:hypothetical protein